MKPYVFTDHMLGRMKERDIRRSWVEEAIFSPELVERQQDWPDRNRLYRRISEYGSRVLCVVADEHDGAIELVTAFFDRKKQL